MINLKSINKFFRVLWVLGFMSCLNSFSQNAPVTQLPEIFADPGVNVDIPIIVSDFNSIGAVSLTMHYDSAVLSFQSSTFDLFPDLLINNPEPGKIIIGGFVSSGTSGITLPDSSVLFTLNFNYLGGTSDLFWTDNGSSCEYSGPSPSYASLVDTPQESYYIDGFVSPFPYPGSAGPITGPPGGNVCAGQTGVIFSVDSISYATDYIWSLPFGASIMSGTNTNVIAVDFSSTASNGNVLVYGVNTYGFGAYSPPFPIVVNTSPEILSQPVSPEAVDACSGIANFSLIAKGTGLFYHWQEYTTDWADIEEGGIYSGSTTESLIITNPPLSMNGNKYRCMVNGTCEPAVISDGNAMLTVREMLSINKQNFENLNNLVFKLYPNPCKENIILDYYMSERGDVEIAIYNTLGQRMQNITYQSDPKGLLQKSIKLVQFDPGIYFVTLQMKINNLLTKSTVLLFVSQ
jgi:hypothetical protein